MSKSGMWLFLLMAACLLSFAGCKKKTIPEADAARASGENEGEVVAKVGDLVITLKDFEKQLEMQNPLVRSRYKSLEHKKKFLDSLVEREVMVLEAKRLGLEKDPEVLHGLKRLLARQLVNKEFNDKRVKQIEISDQQIEQYYQENESRYHVSEKVRVHLIHFRAADSDAKAQNQAKKKAQSTLQKLRADNNDLQSYLKLARELSEDKATKRIGGDTHYKTHSQIEESYGKAFADAAFSMQQPNSLSKEVKSKDGFYILRFAGKQAAIDFPLEKVKGQIRTTLFARARADAYKAFVEEVKGRVGIELFEDVVTKAKVELGSGSPIHVPRHVPRNPKVPSPVVPAPREQPSPKDKATDTKVKQKGANSSQTSKGPAQ